MIPSRLCRLIASALLAASPVASPAPGSAQGGASPHPASVEARVEELLGRMTLPEKIGQLNLASNNPGFDPAEVSGGHVGAVIAFADAPSIAGVQAAARASRLGIPLLVGLDVVHGLRTMFPLGTGEAASFDPDLARRTAQAAAREAAAIGVNWTFAPMVDIARDPRWGRMIEGAGEDPVLGAAFARARVEGFHAGGLATSLKHFIGYGAAAGGRDYDAAAIARSDLIDGYGPPFRAGIEAGSESVMSAFNAVNGVPATADRDMQTGLLRGAMGFDGFVVSDWHAIEQLRAHGVAATPAEAAREALAAGVDMDMASGLYRAHLADEVAAGRVSEAQVTEAARRVLRAKMRAGLFDAAPASGEPSRDVPAPAPAARALARETARDSIVLLRNTGVLPIGPGPVRIALVGGMADSGRAPVGPHGALVRWEDTVTLRQGLAERARAAGASLAFSSGCDDVCTDPSGFDDAVRTAAGADLVVAVLGEPERMTGEGGSRAHLTLPGRQAELLERLASTGRPVVVVLLASRPIELGPVGERLAGLLMAWFPGTEAGHAIADLLFGDENPSAKLPVTWPRTIGQVPLTYDRAPTGRPPEPGNRYTVGYADEQATPLFPFGFGLSYSPFSFTDLSVAAPRLPRDGTLEVAVTLTNGGSRAGREVAQVYLRQEVGAMTRPRRQLEAFRKIGLGPGESRRLVFRIPVRSLGYHLNDGTYVVEPGTYRVFVGASSDATLSVPFEVVE